MFNHFKRFARGALRTLCMLILLDSIVLLLLSLWGAVWNFVVGKAFLLGLLAIASLVVLIIIFKWSGIKRTRPASFFKGALILFLAAYSIFLLLMFGSAHKIPGQTILAHSLGFLLVFFITSRVWTPGKHAKQIGSNNNGIRI